MTQEFEGTYSIKYIRWNMKYDLKSDTFCGQIPSLKYQIIPKISIQLWRCKLQQVDITSLLNLEKFFIRMDLFEKEILKEISYLIPSNCKEDLERLNGLIGEEIKSFLKIQNNFSYFTSLDKFINYFDSICWTPQGTINMIKTAAKIIETTSLSTKEKYVLACANCLEAKIRDLHKFLPKDFSTDIDPCNSLVDLWTRYVREGRKRFSLKERWKLILYTSICGNWDVAVQYFLENYLNYIYGYFEENLFTYNEYCEFKAISLDVLICVINVCVNSNICLYFLQEIPEAQKYMKDIKANKKLLLKLYNVSKWNSIIPVAKYVLELVKFLSICDAFEIIIFCWHKNIINLEQYTILWNELTHDFKLDFKENFQKIFDRIFESCFGLKKTDFVTVKFLMSKSSPKNIKKILHMDEGIFFCGKVIISEGPNFLDNLICQALKRKKCISEYKINYFNDQGLFIIAELITYGKLEWINEFINKFCAEDERAKIKNDLPYIENSAIIQFISHEAKDNEKDFLTALNKFLNWHFAGNEKEICKYISTVFDLELISICIKMFFVTVRDLIEEKKWKIVERYWNWIYFATGEEISSTKVKLTRMIKILLLSSKHQNISPSLRYYHHSELFKRLATSCFKPGELEDLKDLEVRNHLQFLVVELLENDRYQEVNDLIYWFFSSDEIKIDKFKTDFMFSNLGFKFLFNSIKINHNLNNVTFLFKNWLNCSMDLAILFQHRFINFVKEKVESKQENLDQNKNGESNVLKKQIMLNKNVQKCVDLLKVLLCKKNSLDKSNKGMLDFNTNRNPKKRVGENTLFQDQKRRKN